MPQTENPLTDDLLDGAQYLCLRDASLTDRDQFPPGSGTQRCHELHQRRARFNAAREKMKTGMSSLSELGLQSEDCSWAALQANRARDPEEWRSRFEKAKELLEQAH